MATLRKTPSKRLPMKPAATIIVAVARLGRSSREKKLPPGGVACTTFAVCPMRSGRARSGGPLGPVRVRLGFAAEDKIKKIDIGLATGAGEARNLDRSCGLRYHGWAVRGEPRRP